LTDDGNVHTCGYGALGVGKKTIQSLELLHVKELKDIIKVFATTDYAAAINKSGQLFTWGLNGLSGRLGLGNNEHAFIPRLVNIDRKVTDVSLGTNHVLAMCYE
jgi:alpha-tubulin suppressor-like RCC1 family protein